AFPDGEIRGQLLPVDSLSSAPEGVLKTLIGSATGLGVTPVAGSGEPAEISMSGRFRVDAPIDLRVSTAVIGDLLNEVEGAGELVHGVAGGSALPLPLMLVHRADRGKATYRTVADTRRPACQLRIKSRARGTFAYVLACKRADTAGAPFALKQCA